MKKNNKNIIKKMLILLYTSMVVFSVLILLIVIGIIKEASTQEVDNDKKNFSEQAEQDISEEMSETEITETVEKENEDVIQQTDIVYQKPDYDFKLEEITVEIPNISKEYILAWVSDVHLITDHQEATDVKAEFIETINMRYDSMFVTEDGVHSDELWPEIVKFLNYYEFDGIVFGGDMMDYCSESNLNAFMDEYKKINKNIPLLYIRADHDYGFWYGAESLTEPMAHELHKNIDGDELSDKYLDFGEFVIVGVNGSTKDIPSYQYDIISSLYNQKKPVIAVTHVPYESIYDNNDTDILQNYESLESLSMQVRNKIYYWTYFSKQGQYVPNDVTRKYLDMVYSSDTSVCKVLAGHLHSTWDGMISENVSQHIFSPAYTGTIGIIHIKPSAN